MYIYGIDPPVFTQIQILVIASPPAPTAPSKTYCTGDVPTLTVTSPPVGGVFKWYKNSDKTGYLATGASFVPNAIIDPSFVSPGVNTYYVADGQTTGNLCEGPPAQVTLTIRESLNLLDVISGLSPVCLNATGLVCSLLTNPASKPFGGTTVYNWTPPAGWTNLAGNNTKQITVDATGTSGAKTMTVDWRYSTAPN